MTQGDSFAELAEMLDDALRTWIETALTDGDPILVEVSGRGGTGGQPSWSSGLR
ncbi:MAG: type II toxin-antitoxin system HicB family antitoxin [Chloroflexi bacterium]|nr:type II toxin-antitoxin system HicB family antitoxin [Chloroflexota bacterium]